MPRAAMSDVAALTYLLANAIPEPNSGCLLWLGAVMPNGYPISGIHRPSTLVHRTVRQLIAGDVTPDFDVCHHCDVRCCINPDHLFIGTRLDNMQDAAKKGRTLGGERRVAISVATVPRGDQWDRVHKPERISRGEKHSAAMKGKASRGEEHCHAKLTEDDVREIRQLVGAGLLQREIAKRFGVHRSVVAKIVNRTRWAHVV
jgi:predicted DNA-binding protein (UPF0251 family)